MPTTHTLPTAWAAMWMGAAGVPGWVDDEREMERWGRIAPTLDGHRELALLIIERRLRRLRTDTMRAAGRKAFLAAAKTSAPDEFEGMRALLHRQRRVVEMEARWGRPTGWKTGHLVAAGHLRGAKVREMVEFDEPPTVAKMIQKVKPA